MQTSGEMLSGRHIYILFYSAGGFIQNNFNINQCMCSLGIEPIMLLVLTPWARGAQFCKWPPMALSACADTRTQDIMHVTYDGIVECFVGDAMVTTSSHLPTPFPSLFMFSPFLVFFGSATGRHCVISSPSTLSLHLSILQHYVSSACWQAYSIAMHDANSGMSVLTPRCNL